MSTHNVAPPAQTWRAEAARLGSLTAEQYVFADLQALTAGGRAPYDDVMAVYLAAAGATLTEARLQWLSSGAVPHAAYSWAPMNLANACTLTPSTFPGPDPHAIAAVELLLATCTFDDEAPAAVCRYAAEMLVRALEELDRHLLGRRYIPHLAERIGFGRRQIVHRLGDGAYFMCREQVHAAHSFSTLSRISVYDALARCRHPEAVVAVLDDWPEVAAAGKRKPWRGSPFAFRQCINDTARDFSPGSALDILRVLRDHPVFRDDFWATLKAMDRLNSEALAAIEALADESADPEGASIMRRLATPGGAWDVPAEVAARAAVRLRARQIPGPELAMP